MAVFREILTRIGFKVDDGKIRASEVSVAKFKKQMSLAAKEAKRLRSNLNMAMGAAKAMTVAVVGSKALQSLTTAFTGPADKLMKFSAAVGISVEDLQGWIYGATQSGMSAEGLQKSIQKLSVNMAEAARGGKEQQDTFRSIGVAYKDAAGRIRPVGDVLKDISNKFAAAEDGADKVGVSVRLFGKSGAEAINWLNTGSKGIDEFNKKQKRLGGFTEEQGKKAESFNDSIDNTKHVMEGVRAKIASGLLPFLTRASDAFQTWATTGGNVAAMMAHLGTAAKIAGAYLAWMAAQKIAAGLSAIAGAARAAASSLRLMGIAGAWAQVKMGLLIGAFALIGAAVYDMYRITQGQDSFLLKFLGDGKEADAIKAALKGVLATLSEIWTELKPAVMALGLALMDVFRELWKALKPVFPYIVKALAFAIKIAAKLLVAFIKFWAILVKVVARVIAWLAQYIGPIISWIGRAFEIAAASAVAAWEGLKAILVWIGELGITIATAIGRAYAYAADVALKAWNAVIAPFVWLYDKMVAMYDLVVKIKNKVGFSAFLGGGNFIGGAAEVVADQRKRERMAASAPQDNSVKVQSLNVQVTGAPQMTPAELSARIRDGVSNGLQSIIDQAYQNRAQVVP